MVWGGNYMTPAERIIIDATCARVLLIVDEAGRLEAKPWGGDVPPELVHRLREHREDVVETLQGGSKSESGLPSTPHEHEGGNKSNNGLPLPPDGPVKGGNNIESGIPFNPHSVENNPQQNARTTGDGIKSAGVDTVDVNQNPRHIPHSGNLVSADAEFSTTEEFSTTAPNPKSTSDSEPAETDEQQRDRHRREQQESAAEGDQAFWQASDLIRRERAERGNPYAVEPVEGGACRSVLDAIADAWEREPEDAEEALAIWEEQTHRDALTGAAKG